MNPGFFRRFRLTKVSAWYVLVFGVWIAAAVAIAVFVPSDSPAPVPASAVSRAQGEPPVLTEFGDFNCQHCRRFALGFLPLLRRDFIEPGLIEYRYRHMPFLHPGSRHTAEWSECARLQGRFDAFHDAVYAASPSGYLGAVDLEAAGAEAMLDMKALVLCLESGQVRDLVAADEELAAAWGVRGTPALFLDGRRLEYDGYGDLRRQLQAPLD